MGIENQKSKFFEWDDAKVMSKLKEIQEVTEDPRGALGAAVYEGAAKVALDARKMTPVDTGFLKGSTYTEPPKRSGASGIKVVIGQGAEYAASRHSTEQAGRNARSKAHWMQVALDQNSKTLLKKIAIRAEANLKTGQTFGKEDIPKKLDPSNRDDPYIDS